MPKPSIRIAKTFLGPVLLTLACLAALPGRAGAELRFVHAQKASTDGLDGAIGSTLSPDGRQLYVAGFDADALVIFDRDAESGAITFRRAIFDNDAGAAATKGAVVADGLSNVADVAVSPDGRFVYSAGWSDSALGVFERSPDGDLAWREIVFDASLDGVSSIEISEDGSLLWAAAANAASLCLFDRDTADGSLGLPSCVVDPPALAGARGLALAPGGRRALVASMTSGTLAWLDAGSPQGLQVLADGVGGVSGLDGACALDLSAGGDDVYVASWEGQIVHFRRAAAGYDFVAGHELRRQPLVGIRVDPGGRTVYATNHQVRVLERARRNVLDGTLDGFTGSAHALFADRLTGLTGPPEGRQLYATARSGHVVVYRTPPESAVALVHETGGPALPLLARVSALARSPDRSRVFVAGDQGLVALQRDGGSGAVRPLARAAVAGGGKSIAVSAEFVYHASEVSGVVTRRSYTLSTAVDTAAPVSSISELALSPDELHLYALSESDSRLVVFAVGAQGLLSSIANMPVPSGISSVAVSPDGTMVVIASHDPPLVRTFARDPGTGLLSLLGSWVAGLPPGTETAIAFAADSSRAYVTGLQTDQLSVHACDATSGCGPPIQTLRDGSGGVDGMAGASDVLVSSDGGRLYVAGTADDSVAVFRRDQAGGLSFLGSVQNGADNSFSLVRPRALVEIDDDLYAGAYGPLLGPAAIGGVAVLTRRPFFADGFERGDTSAWSVTVP